MVGASNRVNPLRRVVGGVLSPLVVAIGGIAHPAIAQGLCENYLMLPSGRQICFDNSPVVRQRTETESLLTSPDEPVAIDPAEGLSSLDAIAGEGYVAYLNQLETCSPSTAELPFPLTDSVRIRLTIQGPQAAGCAVDMVLINAQSDTEVPYLSCVYSPETLALITDETGYAQAEGLDMGPANSQQETLEGSPTTGRTQAISAAVATECSG